MIVFSALPIVIFVVVAGIAVLVHSWLIFALLKENLCSLRLTESGLVSWLNIPGWNKGTLILLTNNGVHATLLKWRSGNVKGVALHQLSTPIITLVDI